MFSGIDLALALAPLYLSGDDRSYQVRSTMHVIRIQVRPSRAEYFRRYRANRTPLQKAMVRAYNREWEKRKRASKSKRA